jgi:SAM-dependent methyltransferase
MEILNEKLIADLDAKRSVKLNLGSGSKPKEGFYSVDHLPLEGVDVIADLNQPLNLFPDDSIDYIYSSHVFEHIDNLLLLMQEIQRITRKQGTIEILVPHFSNVFGYSDPTHVRLFGLYSMNYFVSKENQPSQRKVPDFYIDEKFIIDVIKIEFLDHTFMDRLLKPILTKLVNYRFFTQELYERRFSTIIHANRIRYILHPDK